MLLVVVVAGVGVVLVGVVGWCGWCWLVVRVRVIGVGGGGGWCCPTLSAVPSGRVEARHRDDEQRVGAGAVLVEVGAGGRPVHVAELKHLEEEEEGQSFVDA